MDEWPKSHLWDAHPWDFWRTEIFLIKDDSSRRIIFVRIVYEPINTLCIKLSLKTNFFCLKYMESCLAKYQSPTYGMIFVFM